MIGKRFATIGTEPPLFASLLAVVTACGGSSKGSGTTTNPVPSITSLAARSTATTGGAAFTLTVNGTNFIPTSTAQWNWSYRTTTYVSAEPGHGCDHGGGYRNFCNGERYRGESDTWRRHVIRGDVYGQRGGGEPGRTEPYTDEF